MEPQVAGAFGANESTINGATGATFSEVAKGASGGAGGLYADMTPSNSGGDGQSADMLSFP